MFEGSDGLMLDAERLEQIATARADDFASATPYQHVVIDDFLDSGVADTLRREFPPPDAPLQWRRNDTTDRGGQVAQANKLGFSDERKLGPAIRHLFWELNSACMLRFLERLTSISDLISDPYLFGGGIHQSMPGAVLAVHADFQRHPVFPWRRQLNFLLFLNETWNDSWGGHLELWDRDMETCVHRIAPVLNRCVVFRTGKDTYHGHPEPLRCPPDVTRKSLATYYYSTDQSGGPTEDERSTLWQRRPSEDPLPAEHQGRLSGLLRRAVHKLRGPS